MLTTTRITITGENLKVLDKASIKKLLQECVSSSEVDAQDAVLVANECGVEVSLSLS